MAAIISDSWTFSAKTRRILDSQSEGYRCQGYRCQGYRCQGYRCQIAKISVSGSSRENRGKSQEDRRKMGGGYSLVRVTLKGMYSRLVRESVKTISLRQWLEFAHSSFSTARPQLSHSFSTAFLQLFQSFSDECNFYLSTSYIFQENLEGWGKDFGEEAKRCTRKS